MEQTELRRQEAVLLAHALVARLADSVSARILFIKGPTAVAVGARPARPSSDVDVLVEPTAFESLCGAFVASGWHLRAPIGTLKHAADLAFDHSAHFIHPEWPCDVDVHYLFPGFLADPAEVFEALWSRRTGVEVAGRRVPTPDLLGQALVVGLHALRDPLKESSLADLTHLETALTARGDVDHRALRDLARETGSSGSASGLLTRLGIEPDPLREEEAVRLADWRARQHGFGRSTMWLVELRRSPWKDKPDALRRAVLPPREHFVGSSRAQDLGRFTLIGLHAQRWARGAIALPDAVRVLALRRKQAAARTSD